MYINRVYSMNYMPWQSNWKHVKILQYY